MKIIEQSHKIEFLMPNPLKWMELAARNSHKSEDRICEGSDEKLIKSLLSLNPPHKTPTEFAVAIVRFITDRGVLCELRTHRLASYLVESSRYVRYDGSMEFIRPVWFKECQVDGAVNKSTLWLDACETSEKYYCQMLQDGAKPEEARQVLNNSVKTDILMMANFSEWRHILQLRTHKSAHPQMRALMIPLLKEFKEKVPVVFDDIKAENDI